MLSIIGGSAVLDNTGSGMVRSFGVRTGPVCLLQLPREGNFRKSTEMKDRTKNIAFQTGRNYHGSGSEFQEIS